MAIEHPYRPLGHGHHALRRLQRRLGLSQRVAAVHDELAEVLGEVTFERRLEGGDLLGRHSVGGERRELDVGQ